jgi:hypothetical protein
MANDGISEIRRLLLEMAKGAVEPEKDARDALIAEINGYQDDLAELGVMRENFDFDNIPDSFLPPLLEQVFQQLKQRKKFLGVK